MVGSKVWKKYGNLTCNEKLIADLKILETQGIVVEKPTMKVVKAGIAAFVGDNLGAHQLAEISTSFSSGPICRYCKATYKDVCENHLLYAGCEEDYVPGRMSTEEYDRLADLADASDGATAVTRGVKGHCCFNSLQSFHCMESMAPCLGHDFYEGVYAYDIQAILNHIINKEKLISIEQFNKKLKKCQMSARDKKNRPNGFKTRASGSKYEGTSSSLRILSRIVTVVLSEVLERSKTMEILIKLHDVSELITAHRLTEYEVLNLLHPTILEYLDLRVSSIESLGFNRARPKHHYLSHYAESFLKFGPLIGVWGMRMESKHTFMKRVIRTAKNFKNPPKTCASRHQLAQISYAYHGLFPTNKLEMPEDTINVFQVKANSNDDFQRRFLSTLDPSAQYPAKVTVLGTSYQPGMILVLKKEVLGELKVGLLKAIAVHDTKIIFGCSSFLCTQSKFGYYVTTKSLSNFELTSYSELWDYHPLHRIGSLQSFIFQLHHFVSQKQN